MLIGSIAIKMGVDQGSFASGLNKSSKAVKAFQSSIGSGAPEIMKGLKMAGGGVGEIAKAFSGGAGKVRKALAPAADVVVQWGKFVGGEALAPIRAGFSAVFNGIASRLSPIFSKIFGGVGALLSKAFGPIKTALAPAFNRIGELASKAASRVGGVMAKGFTAAGRMGVAFGRVLGPIGMGLGLVAVGAVKATIAVARIGFSLAARGARLLASAVSYAGSALVGVLGPAMKFVGVGAAIGIALGVKAASAAAHLNETVSKTKQVFGKSAGGVIETADLMNTAFGTARKEFLDGTAALGGLLQGLGYTEEGSARLSSALGRLAADAAAFRDVPFEEALGKIRAGLSGESEPLKAWGVLIDENSLKSYAFANGLAKQGEELSNAAKVQARLALISQGLAKDQGALAREAESPANAMAEFWGRVQTLLENVGADLAPMLGAALGKVNEAVVFLGNAWDASKDSVFAWAAGVTSSLGLTGGGVDILQKSIGFLADTFLTVKGYALDAFSYIASAVSKVVGVVGTLVSGIASITGAEWAKNLEKSFSAIEASSKTMSNDLAAAAQKALNPDIKPSDVVNAGFDKVRKDMADAKAKLAAQEDVLKNPPKPVDAQELPGKKQEARDPYGKALRRGSVEAASAVMRSDFSKGKDGVAKDTKRSADTLTKIAGFQKRMVDLLAERGGGAPLELMSL